MASSAPQRTSTSTSEFTMVSMKGAQTLAGNTLTGFKYLVSTLLTLASISFVSFGIATDNAALSGHPAMHFGILVFVLILLAYLEGLQVAILALESSDGNVWKDTHPRAYALHKLATTGSNVQRFLVGRQFYVVFVVFLCSQVTTFSTVDRPESFPSFLWFFFVETGLPGALIVLAFGQLMPQLIASRHAVLFCNLRGAMLVLHMTLCLEALGLTNFCWLLTGLVSWLAGITLADDDNAKKSKSCMDVYDPEKGLGSDQAVQVALQGLVKITQNWKKIASMEELSRLCAHLTAENEMSAGAVPVDTAMTNAGMQPSGIADPACQLKYKDTPHAQIYPTPKQVAAYLTEAGQSVPCFLLPPTHKQHVPPHIVAFGLMSGLVQQRESNKKDTCYGNCSTTVSDGSNEQDADVRRLAVEGAEFAEECRGAFELV